MKILLDTHLLLWAAGEVNQLPKEALDFITNDENELFFSAASLWEMAIKHSLGRPDFQVDLKMLRRGLLHNGYEELPINSEHTLMVLSLPAIHKDPFDRILVAQATVEGLLLLTSDELITKYPGPIRKV